MEIRRGSRVFLFRSIFPFPCSPAILTRETEGVYEADKSPPKSTPPPPRNGLLMVGARERVVVRLPILHVEVNEALTAMDSWLFCLVAVGGGETKRKNVGTSFGFAKTGKRVKMYPLFYLWTPKPNPSWSFPSHGSTWRTCLASNFVVIYLCC